MSNEADMGGWSDLLHSSSKLLEQAAPSAQFPPLQRNLDQLEALSKKLKAKTVRTEAPSLSIAATRLLAREGINAEQLARDLKSFELKTTFEDVFPAEATTVEEYLQQEDWQKEKRDFLQSLSRISRLPRTNIMDSSAAASHQGQIVPVTSSLQVSSGTYSTEGTSDSEYKVQDLDEDEDLFSSGDIPKLQLRKVISKARWNDRLGMAEVVERKGKLWTTTGIVRKGKIYCLIEETLYLAEIGALHLLDGDDQPLSLEDIYNKVLDNKNGCCWEAFEVYKHLKSLGYIIGRHGKPWTMKSAKANSVTQVASVDEEVDGESEVNVSLTKMFSGIQIKQVRLLYNVYLPNSKFKKSSPDCPSFVLCLTSSQPPSKEEIKELERQCVGSPLRFCSVDPSGRVSFFEFNRVELPVLP